MSKIDDYEQKIRGQKLRQQYAQYQIYLENLDKNNHSLLSLVKWVASPKK